MDNIIKCKECGTFFQYAYGPKLCRSCAKRLDDIFAQVKDFIYDNPGCSMQQVVDEFGVKVEQIKQWIREDRICFSEESQVGLNCEKCGAFIKSGRFCENCKSELANGFQKLTERTKSLRADSQKPSPRMYTK